MKKVIGIYTFYLGANEPNWDENSNNMGGSETWTIRIADEFQKRGYHTIIFGNPAFWHFSSLGVEYVPRDLFSSRCQYQHFDYFISSRTAIELNANIDCDKIFIMSHEAIINLANTYYDLKPNLVRKIGCLSEWHRDMLIERYPGLTKEQTFITFNGVDTELYSDVDTSKKKMQMVWSSCRERGLDYFLKTAYICVKRMFPALELIICAYNDDIPEEYKNIRGVTVLGKVDKKTLAELQKESLLWLYLNYGDDEETGYRAHETFCITAVENALAKNVIICGNATGLQTTLEGYSGLMGQDLDLSFENVSMETREKLKNEIVDKTLTVLENFSELEEMRNEAYNICQKYTWENAANTWIEEFER